MGGHEAHHTSARGRCQDGRAQASSRFPPPVTATPCGSARWFQWGCCYRGRGPVPAEEERRLLPSRLAGTSTATLPGPGWPKAVGHQQAAETECTGL